MAHYIAIIIEEPGKAVGVWFPDLPGCFSAGDDIDEALLNAPEAIELFLDVLGEEGGRAPKARSLDELRRDPAIATEMTGSLVAAIPFNTPPLRTAAE